MENEQDLQAAVEYGNHLLAELQQQNAELTQRLGRLRFELSKAQKELQDAKPTPDGGDDQPAAVAGDPGSNSAGKPELPAADY